MAQFLQRNFLGMSCFVVGLTRRTSSSSLVAASRSLSTVKKETVPIEEKDIKKSVFISQSTDIFTNLALEDWLYKNHDFSNHHIMMVWRNDPCVVIGRHQNPWLEANIPFLAENDIPLARRNSGGGTVYHDKGNLNVSFFSTKERYNRKYNLELITRALFREFGLKADINARQDIVVKQYKQVSGTAAKLGRPSAYHHCTLLVNADKVNLSQALAKHEAGIKTNATQSVRSPITNLCEENSRVTVDGLQTAVGWEFLRTPALHIADGGQELISKQKGFQMINPTEDWFPGLDKIKQELGSWDWRFGKTPAFEVKRSFAVPSNLLSTGDDFISKEQDSQELCIKMSVESGLIADVTLNIPPGLMASGFHGDASVVTHLKGKKFTSESLDGLQEVLQTTEFDDGVTDSKGGRKLGDKEQFVANCLDQVVNTM